ncbi:MAG: cholesterol oxidase, partial [Actinomycetes bacterium]
SGSKTIFGQWKLTSRQGDGEPSPNWIPSANAAVRILAKKINGEPMGNLGDVIGSTMTAHFVGGCVIGDSAETGVIDAYQRVYGYPGLHVADGAAVSANLGVNPSLTITAQSERAMALWPNKGERDPRPPLGGAYVRIAPSEPNAPVVPPTAPTALRLPLEVI